MASVEVIINTIDKGSDKAASFGQRVGKAWKDLATPLNQTFELLNKVEGAVGAAFDAFEQGAAMARAESQFENLAESIGTTADALQGKLKEATKGMMSDADLIAQGGQIMSLGLAKTEEDVVRLATVVGELGWDMNQTILTLANNSKMRLDALGLSIQDVDEKTEKFIEQGKSMDEAFDLAVLEAAEEKIALVGSAAETAEGKLKMITAAIENVQNAFLQGAAEGFADSISGDELATGMGDAADSAERLGTAVGELVADAMPIAVRMAENLASALSGISGQISFEDDLRALVEQGRIGEELASQLFSYQFIGNEEQKAWAERVVATTKAAVEREAEEARLWENAQKMMFRGGDNSNYEAVEEAAAEAGRIAAKGFNDGFIEIAEPDIAKSLAGFFTESKGVGREAQRAAEELAQEQAAAYAEELAEAMRERIAGTGDLFTTAFNDFMDPETAINFNEVLYASADAAGASASALAGLKIATGELTEAQAEAVLQQAALIDYAEQLGTAIASGTIDPSAAVDMLLEFQTALEEGARGLSPEFVVTPQVTLPADDIQSQLDRWFNGGGDGFTAEGGATTMMLPVEAELAQDSVTTAINEATGMVAAVPLEQRQFLIEADAAGAVTSVNAFVSGTLEPLISTPYTTTIEADVSAALANVEALIGTISRVPRKVNTVFTATVDDSVQNAINAVGG